MNKQVLTKTFSFSKCLLLFFFAFSIILTGCKEDYDDDINDLQSQITKLKEATDKIATLESGIADAKTAAAAALEKANSAEDKAAAALALAQENAAKIEKMGDAEALAIAKEALALAQNNETALEAIQKADEAMQTAISNLQTDLAALSARVKTLEETGLSQADFDKIIEEVLKELSDDIEPRLGELLGHRLTSLVRIPNMTLNDEPAIIFQNITYVPQVFDPLHIEYTHSVIDPITGLGTMTEPWVASGAGEVTKDIVGAKRLYLANEGTVVKYQVSPKIGVRGIDIEEPYFMGDIQTNIEMRSVSDQYTGKNLPIKVAGWSLDSSTGVLSVNVTKAVPADVNINFEGRGTDTQKYYIASLRVPIAEAQRTQDEIDNGVVPEVASEYSRIAETTVVPMIKQNGSEAHHDHVVNYDRQELLNGKNTAGQYVHYHDSVSLYQSATNDLVDHRVHWNEDVDLMKLVTVCEFEKLMIDANGVVTSTTVGSHEDMDWKSYGLEFRFALASKSYFQGDLNTDQQEFATISSNWIMTSRTYSIPGKTETASGREPIVRVQLIDTRNNNNLVAQRYIKFRWTNEKPVTPIEVTFPQDTVTCKMGDSQIFTQQMNEDFYRQLNENGYGLSKDEFHARYKQVEIQSLTKDGVEILTVAPSWIAPTLLTKKELDDTYTGGIYSYGISLGEADNYAKVNNLGGNNHEDQLAEDVIFAMTRDQDQAGMSYNLKWYMSQHAVGPIDKASRKSHYVMKVLFKSQTGAADLEVTFDKYIILPPQVFNYVETYWENNAPKGGTGVFTVNPLVYYTSEDGRPSATAAATAVGTPNPPMTNSGAWITDPNYVGFDYSHIEADMVTGWIYQKGAGAEWANGTNVQPANLNEFIRFIRSCAEVKFVFDESRFGQYTGQKDADGLVRANLSGFETENVGTGLNGVVLRRSGSAVLPSMTGTNYTTRKPWDIQPVGHDGNQDITPLDQYDYIQNDNIAATISNLFGASRDENNGNSTLYGTDQKNYLKWNKEEELGIGSYPNPGTTDKGIANGTIRLHETDHLNGTTSAHELIGKKVPVNLEVTYNMYNIIPEQVFEVYFMDPLKVNNNIDGQFIDAVVNGDYLDANKNLTFTDWNNYKVARIDGDPLGTVEKEKYPWDLWVYYAVSNVRFDVDNTKTSLAWSGNTLVHNPNTTDGPMPIGTSLEQKIADVLANGEPDKLNAQTVLNNPNYLAYFNRGVPVSTMYYLYVPIEVTYKWGKLTSGDSPLRIPVQRHDYVAP